MAGNPDLKPKPRRRDPGLMRMLHAQKDKACPITGVSQWLELHHILPKSQGGDDVRANLMFLHGHVHWLITTGDEKTRRTVGEYLMRERPDTLAYLAEKGAVGWAERQLFIDITWLRSRES